MENEDTATHTGTLTTAPNEDTVDCVPNMKIGKMKKVENIAPGKGKQNEPNSWLRVKIQTLILWKMK